MRPALLLFASFGVIAFCDNQYTWEAPLPTDCRSPCHLVNALANHGFLPHDGLNISMGDLIVALNASVNLAAEGTLLVGSLALLTSQTGNPATFNLDNVDEHNVIEHDGSLSRNDFYFGDDHSFNSTIWDTVSAWFTNDTISIHTAAIARNARLLTASQVNPEFTMSPANALFSQIESSLYLSVFANSTDGVVKSAVTEWVKVMFSDERLPYAEGWTRPVNQLTVGGILELAAVIGVS